MYPTEFKETHWPIYTYFSVVGGPICSNLPFTLERVSWHSDDWIPGNYTWVADTWISVRFISHSVAQICHTTLSGGNCYFLLPGSKQHGIINAVDQCPALWNTEAINRVGRRTGKLIEPWGGTMEVHCRACQLKANSFWWSLLTCVEKNSLELLSLSPMKGCVVKPAELERLQIFFKLCALSVFPRATWNVSWPFTPCSQHSFTIPSLH